MINDQVIGLSFYRNELIFQQVNLRILSKAKSQLTVEGLSRRVKGPTVRRVAVFYGFLNFEGTKAMFPAGIKRNNFYLVSSFFLVSCFCENSS